MEKVTVEDIRHTYEIGNFSDEYVIWLEKLVVERENSIRDTRKSILDKIKKNDDRIKENNDRIKENNEASKRTKAKIIESEKRLKKLRGGLDKLTKQ